MGCGSDLACLCDFLFLDRMATLLITVTTHLATYQLDLDTDIDIELPYTEFVEKLDIHSLLDKEYSGWTKFEIDLYEIPEPEWNKEKLDVEQVVAQFDSN